MTPKERNLSILLVCLIALVVGGMVAYLFVLSPMWEVDKDIAKKRDEVDNAELNLLKTTVEIEKFNRVRIQSLPRGVKGAQGQYAALLEGLLRRSDFKEGFKITMQDPDSKSTPTIAPKAGQQQAKHAYTRLTFELTMRGELYYLVDFLHHFYEQPLLHEIKKLNMQKTTDARARGRNELDVTMTIEAIVLDNAEDRPTLLPAVRELSLLNVALMNNSVSSGKGSPLVATNTLADGREYLAIAGKNVFFGPIKEYKEREEVTPADRDVAPFVTFVSLVEDDEKCTVVLRDKLNNNEYEINQYPDGKLVVLSHWILNEKRKALHPRGNEIITGSEETKNLRRWVVRKVRGLEVILETVDPNKPKSPNHAILWGGFANVMMPNEGKMFKLGLGQNLDAPDAILTREAWEKIYKPERQREAVPVAATEDKGR
jgi:hypothetical protein